MHPTKNARADEPAVKMITIRIPIVAAPIHGDNPLAEVDDLGELIDRAGGQMEGLAEGCLKMREHLNDALLGSVDRMITASRAELFAVEAGGASGDQEVARFLDVRKERLVRLEKAREVLGALHEALGGARDIIRDVLTAPS